MRPVAAKYPVQSLEHSYMLRISYPTAVRVLCVLLNPVNLKPVTDPTRRSITFVDPLTSIAVVKLC